VVNVPGNIEVFLIATGTAVEIDIPKINEQLNAIRKEYCYRIRPSDAYVLVGLNKQS